MKVLQFPLARITLFFITGIVFAFYFTIFPKIVFLLILVSFIFLVVFSFKNNFPSIFFGLTTYILAFFIGISTQMLHNETFYKNHYTNNKIAFKKPCLITATLREKLKSTAFNNRYVAVINTIENKKQSGMFLLIVKKDSSDFKLFVGNKIAFRQVLQKNPVSKNPYQFDYKSYLENKQIYSQVYILPEEIKISDEIEKNIWFYAEKFREKITTNLEKSNFPKPALNLILALILGQQQDISSEVIQDYQYSGAMHILSISGLHIGFIILALQFLLKPIPNSKNGSFLKLCINLVALSLFAIIAGLSPSIVRSVVMFSFVAVGYHLHRSVNFYHTLLVSVLLILLFVPSFLFNVGFQLSYAALFFIVWFQPFLSSLWLPKNKFNKYIWEALTISFAAQVGTFPLSIYYFHQFPSLFFVANLLVLPILSIVMIFGLLIAVLAFFTTIPYYILFPLEKMLYLMNAIIHQVASLENFVIKNIPYNFYFLISSYFLIFTLIIWLYKKTFQSFLIALLAVIFVQITVLLTKKNIFFEQELTVFNTKKQTLIALRKGKEVALFGSDSVLKSLHKNNILNSYLTGNFSYIKNKQKLQNVLLFNQKKILIIDSFAVFPKNAKPNILVLTQSPKINFERTLKLLKPELVIADASNFKSIQKHWKKTCSEQKIPFHATTENGFYNLKSSLKN